MSDSDQESDVEGLPFIVGNPPPHQGQRDVLTSPAGVRVVSKGRRWGGSELIVMDSLSDSFRHGGLTAWILTPTKRMLNRLFEIFVNRIESDEWMGGECRHIPSPRVELENDSMIEFFYSAQVGEVLAHRLDPETPESTLPEYVAVDELDHIREKHREDVRDVLTLDSVDRQLLVGTPAGYKWLPPGSEYRESWLWKEFEPGLEVSSDRECWRFSTFESPFIPNDEMKRVRVELPEDVFSQEYEARWKTTEDDVDE